MRRIESELPAPSTHDCPADAALSSFDEEPLWPAVPQLSPAATPGEELPALDDPAPPRASSWDPPPHPTTVGYQTPAEPGWVNRPPGMPRMMPYNTQSMPPRAILPSNLFIGFEQDDIDNIIEFFGSTEDLLVQYNYWAAHFANPEELVHSRGSARPIALPATPESREMGAITGLHQLAPESCSNRSAQTSRQWQWMHHMQQH